MPMIQQSGGAQPSLQQIANKCAPNPYTSSNAPVAYSGATSLSIGPVNDCQTFIQHIWSCAECRRKMRSLLCDSDSAGVPVSNQVMPKPPVAQPVSSFTLPTHIDLPNLVYYVLIGMVLIIFLDIVLRLGKR
jgi:hypothetical protein